MFSRPIREDIREFSVELRDDLADGLCGTSGRGNDVVVDATSTTPVFARWTIDSLLCGSGCMDGAHKALDDAKFVVDDFGNWGKTIGSARCIGNLASKAK